MSPPSVDLAPPWCRRLIAEFTEADDRARGLAGSLLPEQLTWSPHPGTWSIAHCLEHLGVANRVYLAPIAASLAGRAPGMVQEITPGWFGRWFIRNYIEPSANMRRASAPRKIRPPARVEPGVLDRFLASNAAARNVIRRASGHDVNRIRFRNPFVPVIFFTVGTGFEILSKHQRRHLLQAERIRASEDFPG